MMTPTEKLVTINGVIHTGKVVANGVELNAETLQALSHFSMSLNTSDKKRSILKTALKLAGEEMEIDSLFYVVLEHAHDLLESFEPKQ